MRLLSANEGTLEPYLSQFDVEKLEIASMIGICGSLVGPKSGNVAKVLVFKAFLNGQGCDGYAGARLRRSGPEHFLFTLRSLFNIRGYFLSHFGITSRLLCGNIGYMKVCFQETLIFPTYFNGFIKLWGNRNHQHSYLFHKQTLK